MQDLSNIESILQPRRDSLPFGFDTLLKRCDPEAVLEDVPLLSRLASFEVPSKAFRLLSPKERAPRESGNPFGSRSWDRPRGVQAFEETLKDSPSPRPHCLTTASVSRTAPTVNLACSNYHPKLQGYGELFKIISETQHQSCLLITSREKIPDLAKWEGNYLPVRCLQLQGLSTTAGKEIFATKGDFIASEDQWQTLSDRYGGNPLALKIVASAIKDFFASDIASFLAILTQSSFLFDDIQTLLQQQFDRLIDLEKQIMYWLAIEREPISFLELKSNFINHISPEEILRGLTSLQARSLIEQKESYFSQQTVVMEFVVNDFIKQVSQEILTQKINLFNNYCIFKAQAKDYIKETQAKAIAQPIIDSLLATYNTPQNLADRLKQIIHLAKDQELFKKGYLSGNIINLLRQLNIDLIGYDFSDLTIRQANLQAINLHNVNFTNADLSQAVFTETLVQLG